MMSECVRPVSRIAGNGTAPGRDDHSRFGVIVSWMMSWFARSRTRSPKIAISENCPGMGTQSSSGGMVVLNVEGVDHFFLVAARPGHDSRNDKLVVRDAPAVDFINEFEVIPADHHSPVLVVTGQLPACPPRREERRQVFSQVCPCLANPLRDLDRRFGIGWRLQGWSNFIHCGLG